MEKKNKLILSCIALAVFCCILLIFFLVIRPLVRNLKSAQEIMANVSESAPAQAEDAAPADYSELWTQKTVTYYDEEDNPYRIHTYDREGRLLREDEKEWEYDAAGNKTVERVYSETGDERELYSEKVFTYTEDGKILREAYCVMRNGVLTPNYEVDYTYDEYGDIVSEIETTHDGAFADEDHYTYQRDEAGHMLSMEHHGTYYQEDYIATETYTLNENGDPIQIRHYSKSVCSNDTYVNESTETIEYNEQGQKIRSQEDDDENRWYEYTYYDNGDRKSALRYYKGEIVFGYTYYEDGTVHEYYNNGAREEYDKDGRRIDDVFSYDYDDAGRVIHSAEILGPNNIKHIRYEYDEHNLLVRTTATQEVIDRGTEHLSYYCIIEYTF